MTVDQTPSVVDRVTRLISESIELCNAGEYEASGERLRQARELIEDA